MKHRNQLTSKKNLQQPELPKTDTGHKEIHNRSRGRHRTTFRLAHSIQRIDSHR